MSTDEQIISRIRRIAEIKPQLKAYLDALCTTLEMEGAGQVFDSGADMEAWPDLIARRENGGYTFHDEEDLGTVVDSSIPYEDRAWNKVGFPAEPDIVKAGFAYMTDYILSKGGRIAGVNGTQNRAAVLTGMFSAAGMDMSKCVFFPGPPMLDTSGITNWAGAFENNNTLLEMGERLDVSGARNGGSAPCARMFLNCRSLKALPEMDFSGIRLETGIDSSSRSLFAGCTSLEDATGLLNYGAYDSAIGHQFNALFHSCKRLVRLPSVEWRYARQLNATFTGCAFSELDMSGWDLTNVTSMSGTFSGCRNLRRLVLPACPKVTAVNSLCYQCYSLEHADLSGAGMRPAVANWAFYRNTALRTLRLGDLGGITMSAGAYNTDRMLDGCTSLSLLEFCGEVTPPVLLAVLRTVPGKQGGGPALDIRMRAADMQTLQGSAQWPAVRDLCQASNFNLSAL